eukprot:gene24984-26975_t
MALVREDRTAFRRPMTVSIDEHPVADAGALGINVSRACEQGLDAEVRAERARRWKEDNREANAAWAEYVEKHVLMARFDVYKTDDFDGLALDCQADVLDDLTTRFVLPLVAGADIRRTYSHLNPTFTIEDRRYVLAPQGAATISRRSI